MAIKTTLYLKRSQSVLLYELSERFNVSLSWIMNSLARKVFKSLSLSVQFWQSVKYQERLADVCDKWKRVPVSFEEVVYEKCLDIRKVAKLSVSRVFADAIVKYLDELILELEGEKTSDNYSANYILLGTKTSNFCQITLLWDMIEEEKLKKYQKLQAEVCKEQL